MSWWVQPCSTRFTWKIKPLIFSMIGRSPPFCWVGGICFPYKSFQQNQTIVPPMLPFCFDISLIICKEIHLVWSITGLSWIGVDLETLFPHFLVLVAGNSLPAAAAATLISKHAAADGRDAGKRASLQKCDSVYQVDYVSRMKPWKQPKYKGWTNQNGDFIIRNEWIICRMASKLEIWFHRGCRWFSWLLAPFDVPIIWTSPMMVWMVRLVL